MNIQLAVTEPSVGESPSLLARVGPGGGAGRGSPYPGASGNGGRGRSFGDQRQQRSGGGNSKQARGGGNGGGGRGGRGGGFEGPRWKRHEDLPSAKELDEEMDDYREKGEARARMDTD